MAETEIPEGEVSETPDVIEDNKSANTIASMLWVWKWENRASLEFETNEDSIFIKFPDPIGVKFMGGFLETSGDKIANIIFKYRFFYINQYGDPMSKDPYRGYKYPDPPIFTTPLENFYLNVAGEKERLEKKLVAENLDTYTVNSYDDSYEVDVLVDYEVSEAYKVEADSPIKNFHKEDACFIKSEPTQYYLRFGALLQYLKSNVIPKIDTEDPDHSNKPPMFNVSYQPYKNFMYVLPNSISLDPRVCIVRNDNFRKTAGDVEVFKNLQPFRATDYGNIAEPNKAYIMNIYLNFNFIIESLNSNTDERGDISVFEFLKVICDGLNKSLGGINNLEPIINEETNTLEIIETTPIPGVNNTNTPPYTLQLYGYNKIGNGYISNFVRKVDLKTAITPEYATMITVGATAGGYVKGTEATAFSRWNEGLTDRFKEKFLPANANSLEEGGEDEALTNYTQQFLSPEKIIKCYGFSGTVPTDAASPIKGLKLSEDAISSNLSVVTEYYKWLIASQKNQQGGTIGFIPFKLSFTMNGLSGIKIYNKLHVDTRFLPKAYGSTVDLIVTGVSHKLQNNDWETDIEATLIPQTTNIENPIISATVINDSINNATTITSCNSLPPSKGLSSSVKGLIKASTTKDSIIVQAIVDNLEGGYYHPTHAFSFSQTDRNTYKNSGETLYGLDRYAGNNEGIRKGPKNQSGIDFWAAVDIISGNGSYKNTSRTVNTGQWDIKKYPKKSGIWSWNYMPKKSESGYDNLQKHLTKYITNSYNSLFNKYLAGHPVGQLVQNDGRLKFMYYRATWNGSSFFQKYASNLKAVYDKGEKNIDNLICADLTFRYNTKAPAFKPGVSKISFMMDYKKP